MNQHVAQNISASHEAENSGSEQGEKILSNPSNYFGLMAMTMTIGSIWGGVVAMFALKADAHPVILFLNVMAAMANNVASIAQLEFKVMMRVFYISIVVNGLILAYLLLS